MAESQNHYLAVYGNMNEGNFPSAINSLGLIISESPEDVQAYRLRSTLYRALGEEDLAQADDLRFTQLDGETLRSKEQFDEYYRPARTWVFLAKLNFLLLFILVGFVTIPLIAFYRVLRAIFSGDVNGIKKTFNFLQAITSIPFNVILSTLYWVPAEFINQRKFLKQQWEGWQLGIDCIDTTGKPIRQWRFGMNLSKGANSGISGAIEVWNLINDFM